MERKAEVAVLSLCTDVANDLLRLPTEYGKSPNEMIQSDWIVVPITVKPGQLN
jgi:hypothetical protein